jgi:hypothetical protein
MRWKPRCVAAIFTGLVDAITILDISVFSVPVPVRQIGYNIGKHFLRTLYTKAPAAMQQTLSAIIQGVFDTQKDASTYGKVIDEIDQHGMAVILILFSLPSALPIPAAGYSTVLSIPLFIIGFRLLLGYNTLWMPAAWRGKAFRPEQFSRKMIDGMLRLIQFVERWTKPRLVSLTRSHWIRVVLGILIITLACSMLLPIPGTNTAPAFGIFLIGFALLEEDGVMLLVGVAASLLALALSLAVILFGYTVVKGMLSSVF